MIFRYKGIKKWFVRSLITALLLVNSTLIVKSQVVFNESFDNSNFPAGWSIEQQPMNWSVSPTAQAGGNPSEMRFSSTPVFFNYSRLISPYINLSSAILAKLEFIYSIGHINSGYTFGLAVRNASGPWSLLWSIVPFGSVLSAHQTIVLNYPGFNTANFQFAFFYQGNSANINSIYIDDIDIILPPLHDIAVSEILNPEIYLPTLAFIPQVLVTNRGQMTENNFTITCKLYDGNNNLIYNNQQLMSQLPGAESDTLSFPSYVLPYSNEYYRMEASTSLSQDSDTSNDSLEKTIKTLTLVDRKFVLAEIGTATWCTSCPAASVAVNDLLLAGKQMAVAEYHSPTADIFTNTYAAERLAYYDILGYPTAYFDGVVSYAGNSNVYNEYNAKYNQRISLATPYDIKIFGSHTASQYNLNVILYRMAPVDHGNLVLRVLLTESSINYLWLGQNQLNHVVRRMIPSAGGIPVDLINQVQINVPLSFTMEASWNPYNCEIIAFLQDTITKEVLQVNKRNYYELVPLGFQKIQGYVRYRNSVNSPLPGVSVKLRLGGGVVAAATTAANGYYSFTGIAPGSYYLSCSYSGTWGGANAADALSIMKYFTNLESLDALQIKAADNDVSNNVNAIDAMNIMSRFVGIANKFNQSDWVFENPLIVLPNSTIVNQNIKGLCTGDTNGSDVP